MCEISMNIGGIIGRNCDSKQKLIEKLMLFKEAGITYLDGMCVSNDLISTDKWIYDFKAAIEEVGLHVGQTHLPIFGQINTETGSPVWKLNEEEKKLIETGFRSNAVWECKNVVVHPHTGYPKSANKDIITYRKMNMDYFKLLLEYAHKYDVNICMETMFSLVVEGNYYCANPLELKELHDALNDEKIKYCVDTGHLNCDGYDVADTIRLLGNDVVVLHLQDNCGLIDGHCLPPFGNIDWQQVAGALKEIQYSGTINFEVGGGRLSAMDRDAQIAYLKYAYEMGQYIGRMMYAINS